MPRFIIWSLWLVPVLLLQTSCNKRDGSTENGGPVSNARAENNSGQPDTPSRAEVISRLKKSANSTSNSNSIAAVFKERATELGLEFVLDRDAVPGRFFFPEVMGSGMGWIDYDLDGVWDLYLGNGDRLVGQSHQNNQLFRNRIESKFDNVTSSAANEGNGYAQGIAVGDSNRDGFDDIFVSNYGQNYLLVNQGDGSFQRQWVGNPEVEPIWSSSCIQVDLDSDGDLDLFAVSYLDWTVENHHPCVYKGVTGYCGPGTYEGTTELVYINEGDGRYREAHQEKGISQRSKGLVVGAADFDGDRIPEIYIGSDLTRNMMYRRRAGENKFVEVGADAGVAVSKNGLAEATMGLAIRDFNGDRLPDMFLTHYFQNKNTLYLNEGGLLFKDASYETRIKALSFDFIGFGTVPIDYDNDADFDLFISNGHVLGEQIPPFRLKPQLLSNQDSRFFDVSAESGSYFGVEFAGRSVASCDFDNDGDVDLAVGHLDQPLALLVNETTSENRYIQIHLLDHHRRDLTGTRVVVAFGDQKHVLPVVRGESYLASVDPRLHMGVRSAEKVSVTVEWCFGLTSEYKDLETNSTWLLQSNEQSAKLH